MAKSSDGKGLPMLSMRVGAGRGFAAVHRLVIPFLLIVTVAAGHYLRIFQFGLYEDDYVIVGFPLGWNLVAAIQQIAAALEGWWQGRPIGYAVPWLLAFTSGSLLGIPGVYLVCSAIIACNALLVFRLARWFGPPLPALAAGLTYCLFPADTSKLWPTHIQLHLAMMFALLAADNILRRRKIATVFLLMLILLTYETPFMPLLFVPLLAAWPWEGAWSRWSVHLLIMGTSLTAAILVRLSLQESRILETLGGDPWVLIARIVESPFVGIAVSLKMMWMRPLQTLSTMQWTEWIVIIFYFILLVCTVASLRVTEKLFPDISTLPSSSRAEPPLESAGRVITAGILMWLAGYLLSFTHWPPVATVGSGTRVHAAATLGASVTVGALVWLLDQNIRGRILRKATLCCIAGYFSLLVGFHLTVQREFAQSWRLQRDFWQQVVDLCPDLEDGTRVFVEPDGLPQVDMALVNSWADPLILGQIFQFPKEWSSPPRLFVLYADVVQTFSETDGSIRWQVPEATWVTHPEVLDRAKIILLKEEWGRLTRVTGAVRIGPVEITAKAFPSSRKRSFAVGALYGPLLTAGHSQ
jgi:hypothetical protein